MYTVCFTGHRKIRNSYYNTSNPTSDWAQLKGYLKDCINVFAANKVNTFISGMAIGVDIMAAEAVLDVRNSLSTNIQLVAAIPFPSQPSNWPSASKDNYYRILSQCANKVMVNEDPYEAWKMHARDKYMVENSHYVIAVWDGREGGGTYSTVKYAKEAKRLIFVINPETCTGNWLGATS